MLVALIVNPHATKVSERVRHRVTAALAVEHKVKVHLTGQPGHGGELTRRAVDDGAELVVVLGGDGTVNEVVNGLSGTSVPLGLAGGGKTNVFARGLGLPGDTTHACDRLLELLRAGTVRRISLGNADGRAFTFGAGLGLDGAIVRDVERRRRARQLYGDSAYVAAGLKTLFLSYDREHPHLKVQRAPGSRCCTTSGASCWSRTCPWPSSSTASISATRRGSSSGWRNTPWRWWRPPPPARRGRVRRGRRRARGGAPRGGH